MPAKLPKPVWNLLAVFFAAWSIASAWLLLGGESSPVVRLAFALCGAATLFAGTIGGLFRGLGRRTVRVLDWLSGKKLGCWVGVLVVVGLLAAILAPVFLAADGKATSSSIRSELKQEVLALLAYAEAHDGILPPDMNNQFRTVSLLPYRYASEAHHTSRADRGKPFVWCKSLAGLRLSDIASPDKVVVAYSTVLTVGVHADGYSVVFLDGHTKAARTRQELLALLRERPALLAHAVRAKAKRYADAKPIEKKAAP